MALDDAFRVTFHTQKVGEVEVFYREVGPKDAPVLLLLHGFPSASHMFRDLMPLLANQYRLIAPDLPGFGNTKAPSRGQFDYSFENLYKVIEGFTEALGLKKYALYIFDYGAPTGLRLAAANPEKVTAIISQNGNAYLEGFSDQWGPWQSYWRDPRPPIARPVALRCRRRRLVTGNTEQDLIRRSFHRTATTSTSCTWLGQCRGDPAGPDSRLPHQCGGLPGVSGVLAQIPAAVAGRLGQA